MPTPQPPGTLKRPPVINAGGSSSSSLSSILRTDRPPLGSGSSSFSLSGLEQIVPSFQSFVKRTPSLNADIDKPLPPRPIAPKRSFNSLADALNRRSSSVYSRTPSQFTPQTPSWRAQDPEADSPLLFRPMAYSASSPDLSSSEISTPPLLEPRHFSPLIESPRATTVASNSRPQSRAHSTLASLPTPSPGSSAIPAMYFPPIDTQIPPAAAGLTSPTIHHGPRQPVRTVSLEKAKETMNAPGAVRLLPEELRAQALKKVNSQGHIRLESIDIFGGAPKMPLPPAIPTMTDRQGRERALQTPSGVEIPNGVYPFPCPSLPKTSAAYNSFHVGAGPVREMAPPVADSESQSRITWRQLSHEGADEPRGRIVERRSHERNSARSDPEVFVNDAQPYARAVQSQNLATEYHSLLSQQQYRQASDSPGYSSDESVRTHMKMVPQPLFQAKRPPPIRRSDSSRNSGSSISPFNIHKSGRSDGSTSSEIRSTGFGLRISLEPLDSRDRHSSTTGMIPISPPSDMDIERARPPHIDTTHWQPNTHKSKSLSRENSRESSFYPHIMRRKNPKKKEANLPPPGKPLLATDVIAQKLKTPASTPDTSPTQSSHIVAARKPSSVGGSEKESKKFYRRFGKGRMRSSNRSYMSTMSDRESSKASPTSPHLFPSPVNKTPNNHLDWSDTAKKIFDDARSSTPPNGRRLTHIAAPPRPLDHSKTSQTEPESPTTPTSPKRPSLFGSVLDSRRENKAQKRREDLKRLIKVVPVMEVSSDAEDGGNGANGERGTRSGGRKGSSVPGGVSGMVPRRISGYGWM